MKLLRIKQIKIRNIYLIFIFLIILILASCQKIKVSTKSLFYFDTVVNITLYNDDNATKHIDEMQDIFSEISKYASDYNSYNSSSIYDLNKNRSIKTNNIVKEI